MRGNAVYSSDTEEDPNPVEEVIVFLRTAVGLRLKLSTRDLSSHDGNLVCLWLAITGSVTSMCFQSRPYWVAKEGKAQSNTEIWLREKKKKKKDLHGTTFFSHFILSHWLPNAEKKLDRFGSCCPTRTFPISQLNDLQCLFLFHHIISGMKKYFFLNNKQTNQPPTLKPNNREFNDLRNNSTDRSLGIVNKSPERHPSQFIDRRLLCHY